jgi:hypothetical protein
MLRHGRLGLVGVIAITLVMLLGMAGPTLALESRGDSVQVTGTVLPYLEIQIPETTLDFGTLPSVWSGEFYETQGFSLFVTSNLSYETQILGADNSEGLADNEHFGVWLGVPGGAGGIRIPTSPGESKDAVMGGDPAVAFEHVRVIGLDLWEIAIPLPPGSIDYTVTFTVAQS